LVIPLNSLLFLFHTEPSQGSFSLSVPFSGISSFTCPLTSGIPFWIQLCPLS
jgi:hypothetical protein